MDTEPITDPVGTGEIAKRCNVEPQTVRAWRVRGHLPEPHQIVGNRGIWSWPMLVSTSPMVARYVAEQRLAETRKVAADG